MTWFLFILRVLYTSLFPKCVGKEGHRNLQPLTIVHQLIAYCFFKKSNHLKKDRHIFSGIQRTIQEGNVYKNQYEYWKESEMRWSLLYSIYREICLERETPVSYHPWSAHYLVHTYVGRTRVAQDFLRRRQPVHVFHCPYAFAEYVRSKHSIISACWTK